MGEDKEFKVHKLILWNASKVFKKMLSGSYKENVENVCIIEDFSPDTMAIMLEYIYNNKICQNLEATESLIRCADKYQIMGLKQALENKFISQLRPENAFYYWEILKRHQTSKNVGTKLLEYVCFHWQDLSYIWK